MTMKYKLIVSCMTISAIALLVDLTAAAAPYGRGVYNADVPYGSQTSLSISAGSSVNLSLNPSTSGTLASASGMVTVYSTDVVGYKLYLRAIGSTSMVQGAYTIPASGNSTPGALAVNTWGFNTNGSADFIGAKTTDLLLKDADGPFGSGDSTQVTYGLRLDRSKPAGAYSASIMYSAVPETP